MQDGEGNAQWTLGLAEELADQDDLFEALTERAGFGSGVGAAAVFDAILRGEGVDDPELAEHLEVIARPGDPVPASLEVGTLWIRRALGEGRLARVAVVAAPAAYHRGELRGQGLQPECDADGLYAHVVETGPFARHRAEGFARRISHDARHLAPDSLLLRWRSPSQSFGAEGHAESTGKYEILVEGWSSVPSSLRAGVKRTMIDAFAGVPKVELVWSAVRGRKYDCTLTFTRRRAALTWGEHSRLEINGVKAEGEATVYVGSMIATRIEKTGGGCEPGFQNTDASLGSMIANVAVHEIAHAIGLDVGGPDDDGHVTDRSNYMWATSTIRPRPDLRVNHGRYDYTVVRGDTLSEIVARWSRGTLHPCARGPEGLTYQQVWAYPQNAAHGFIAHPDKSGVPGRIKGSPDWIYPGEKVALFFANFRPRAYMRYYTGWLGAKTFSAAQITQMTTWVDARLRHLASTP